MTAPVQVEHEILVSAPAEEIYRLLADVQNWPRLFPPTVYVDRFEQSGDSERIRIWATANGEVKKWTSRRVLEPDKLRIEFRQEISQPPVASMGGLWLIEEVSKTESRVRLQHDYTAIDDDPAALEWIAQAVDRNSRAELAALKSNLELVTDAAGELVFSFTDTVEIDGPASEVFDFLNQAQLWQQRLPHVARVALTEESPGLQVLEMETFTKDGSSHTTKSVRVCFPNHKIVYKQTTLPALMSSHTGCWEIATAASGVLSVSSEHTVVINETNIAAIMGPDAGVPRAREFVRQALGGNSRATLGYAKEYAESRR